MINEKKSHFIVILGPPAVGKMTIGQMLAKQNNFKLFHNHAIIEALLPIFEFGSEAFKRLVREFRTRVFEELILEKPLGIIFTFIVNFKINTGPEMLLKWLNLFQKNDFEICIIELSADLSTRLQRNETPNRLEHKYSKRNLDFSRKILLKNEQEWLMECPEYFILR